MNNDRVYRKSAIPETAKKVFDGIIFDVYQWEQELYDGSKTTFEKLSRQDTVSIFPVLEDGTILIIDDTQPTRGTQLRIPMGRLDEGEDPMAAGKRELLEETGLVAREWVPFYDFEFYEKIDWRIYVYIAKGCKKVQEQNEGPGERIVSKIVTFDELLDLTLNSDLKRLTEFALMVYAAKLDPAKMANLKAAFGV